MLPHLEIGKLRYNKAVYLVYFTQLGNSQAGAQIQTGLGGKVLGRRKKEELTSAS